MRFHGTFIGVDRYQAADIGFLTSAVRDATALHALFANGFQGNPVLLTDAGATQAKIVEELQSMIHSLRDGNAGA
jgi:helicase